MAIVRYYSEQSSARLSRRRANQQCTDPGGWSLKTFSFSRLSVWKIKVFQEGKGERKLIGREKLHIRARP